MDSVVAQENWTNFGEQGEVESLIKTKVLSS